MIERQSMDVDESGKDRTPTQFITTTFRPELIRAGLLQPTCLVTAWASLGVGGGFSLP
jgi:hypothetical protein